MFEMNNPLLFMQSENKEDYSLMSTVT